MDLLLGMTTRLSTLPQGGILHEKAHMNADPEP